MSNPMWIAVLTVLLATASALVFFQIGRKRRAARATVERAPVPIGTGDGTSEAIPYSTAATQEIAAQCHKLAFGVSRFDYQIFAEHALVLEQTGKKLMSVARREEYFPRRPLMLPKLLQALNDTESTRKELVRLILEDPTLAGVTLKRANAALYRLNPEPVETLDRAVALLGTEGLRGLLATAILQPVFRAPKGVFDGFAELAWEHARRSAAGAQSHADATGDADPFVAQLLGVLRSLASLVLFRLTLDTYRQHPGVLPRPEVFIQVLQVHRARFAHEIAQAWQLSSASLAALDEQQREISPRAMSTLGCALYYGELGGSLAILAERHLQSPHGAQAVLVQQGLPPNTAQSVLHAARGEPLTS